MNATAAALTLLLTLLLLVVFQVSSSQFDRRQRKSLIPPLVSKNDQLLLVKCADGGEAKLGPSSSVRFLVRLEGGAKSSKPINRTPPTDLLARAKSAVLVSMVAALCYAAFTNRQIFKKEVLLERTLDLLNQVNQSPRGLVYYILGFTVWECVGLSTIPVETAAGMAFGFHQGVLGSTCGKLLGASAAFLIGRTFLQDWVRERLANNVNFRLSEQEVTYRPIATALMLKYSCFPEFVKNYGSSLLKPIPLWAYVGATLLHGGPFTLLWCYLGMDSHKRMQDHSHPPDPILKAGLIVAGIVGFVVSPLGMAWWIRDLRHRQKQKDRRHSHRRQEGLRNAS